MTSQIDMYLNRDIVFIVGSQSSGTTLMRLLLDSHSNINCGDETGIIHLLLKLVRNEYLLDPFYIQFMSDFGIKNQTVAKAAALFIYYMMENNLKNTEVDINRVKYLCNKGHI